MGTPTSVKVIFPIGDSLFIRQWGETPQRSGLGNLPFWKALHVVISVLIERKDPPSTAVTLVEVNVAHG